MKVKLLSTDNEILVNIIHTVYKIRRVRVQEADGSIVFQEREKLVKQMPVKKWFRKDAIVSVEEYVTVKNTIAKNRSILYDRFSGRSYATFHNPQELWSTVNKPPLDKPIGYNIKR